nr:hypothetical protein [uncultured Desulfobulbus sp.]
MQLLKFRIIGHQNFSQSAWIDVGKGISILAPSTIHQAKGLLESLQAVNPPYDFHQLDPFADFPVSNQTDAYTRKIIPAKKTAAIAIYTAAPALVQALAAIDSLYFKTDRIEVGRRRDYSRWMNFVELPASARWSEIDEMLRPLLSHLALDAGPWRDRFQEMVQTWQHTDRLRGERAHRLSLHLQGLQALLPPQYHDQLNRCRQRVDLATHFVQAKAVAATLLPIFYALPSTSLDISPNDPLAFLVNRLSQRFQDKPTLERIIARLNRQWLACEAGICLEMEAESGAPVIVSNKFAELFDEGAPMRKGVLGSIMQGIALLHQVVYGCDPIFLLDLQRLHLSLQDQVLRLEQLHKTCNSFQCLVIPDQALLDFCHDSGRIALNDFPRLHIITL